MREPELLSPTALILIVGTVVVLMPKLLTLVNDLAFKSTAPVAPVYGTALTSAAVNTTVPV